MKSADSDNPESAKIRRILADFHGVQYVQYGENLIKSGEENKSGTLGEISFKLLLNYIILLEFYLPNIFKKSAKIRPEIRENPRISDNPDSGF